MFVKICGMKTEEQIKYAAKLNYSMIGVVLHKRSKRFVDIEKAKELAKCAKETGIKSAAVGLTYDEVQNVAEYFDYIQIYEPVNTRFPTIFATSEEPADNIKYEYLLYDISKGSGAFENFRNWIEKYRETIILAGGLNANNVARIIRRYRPFGVDVSSGVEDETGKKNFDKMRKFILQTMF
ncbi:MAG: phosphoribosylanthranilate isomerase [Flexistipes sinusarabici]|uniref:N-(5'-phosphoribosyl)anthranilate isomerase n=1 Tax=Flexistipes sinusarabici TaxID=2352 RepID=A0A5D0MNT8_FLESI|nr:phosphoribosylanthranilate isomerase [Flexistipes sinusarabici]TYB33233.1 MAG: phosphoribosylanthranilate isomerase [Flexistipes sinusarabici]